MNPWLALLLVYCLGLCYSAGLLTPDLRRFASGDLLAHMSRNAFWFTVVVSLLAWPYGLWRYFNRIRDPIMDRLIDTPIQPQMPEPLDCPPEPEIPNLFLDGDAAPDTPIEELRPAIHCAHCSKVTEHGILWRCNVCHTIEVSP